MMNEVQDPVRFLVEMQASIHHQNEKLWHFNKKIVSEKFFVRLKEVMVQSLNFHVKVKVVRDFTTITEC